MDLAFKEFYSSDINRHQLGKIANKYTTTSLNSADVFYILGNAVEIPFLLSGEIYIFV